MTNKVDCTKLKSTMDGWPDSWKGVDGDVAVGRRMVEDLRPFVVALIASGVSPGTIRRHLNNLWLLGGEIIAQTQHDARLRRNTGRELLRAFVDDDGGPLSRHNRTEAEQRAFDSTCRKLHRFLTARLE